MGVLKRFFKCSDETCNNEWGSIAYKVSSLNTVYGTKRYFKIFRWRINSAQSVRRSLATTKQSKKRKMDFY